MGKVTSHSTGLYVSSGSLSSIMPFDCDPIAPPLTGQDLILRQDGNGDWQNLPSGGFSGACGDLVSNARGVFLIGTFGPRRYIP